MPRKQDPFKENDWVSVVLGVAVVMVVLGSLVYFGPRSGESENVEIDTAMPANASTPVERSTNRPLNSGHQSETGVRRSIEPDVADRAARDYAEKRRRLSSLKQTCDHWTRKNTRGQYAALQASACADMQKLAAELGQSTHVTIRRPDLKRETTRQRRKYVAGVDDCKRFGVGSIRYRRCRAKEKDQLGANCQRYRQELYVSTGTERERVRERERAWCLAYNEYQVVR